MPDMPHPLIVETMNRLKSLSAAERGKVHFFQLNHANPALRLNSRARTEVANAGFKIAFEGEYEPL